MACCLRMYIFANYSAEKNRHCLPIPKEHLFLMHSCANTEIDTTVTAY